MQAIQQRLDSVFADVESFCCRRQRQQNTLQGDANATAASNSNSVSPPLMDKLLSVARYKEILLQEESVAENDSSVRLQHQAERLELYSMLHRLCEDVTSLRHQLSLQKQARKVSIASSAFAQPPGHRASYVLPAAFGDAGAAPWTAFSQPEECSDRRESSCLSANGDFLPPGDSLTSTPPFGPNKRGSLQPSLGAVSPAAARKESLWNDSVSALALQKLLASVKEGQLQHQGEDDAGFETMNNYAIITELGRGNYGKVTLACDEEGNQVAIKTMSCGTKSPKHRFSGAAFPTPRGASLETSEGGIRIQVNSMSLSPQSKSIQSPMALKPFLLNATTTTTSSSSPSEGSKLGGASGLLEINSLSLRSGQAGPLMPPPPPPLVAPQITSAPSSAASTALSASASVPPEETMVMKEVAIMKKLRHKNIVQLREVIHDVEEDQVHLVMDYIPNGAIAEMLPGGRCDRKLDLPLIKSYIRQATYGLEYLHRQGIVHRDIKPENLLVGDKEDLYLADFGVSAVLREDKVVDITAGTQLFFSPELVRGDFEEASRYGKQSDIWALGVTFYALAFGKVPFFSENLIALAQNVLNDELSFPEDLPADDPLREIMAGLLNKDPEQRWSLRQLRHHPAMRAATCEEQQPQGEENVPRSSSTSGFVAKKRKSVNPAGQQQQQDSHLLDAADDQEGGSVLIPLDETMPPMANTDAYLFVPDAAHGAGSSVSSRAPSIIATRQPSPVSTVSPPKSRRTSGSSEDNSEASQSIEVTRDEILEAVCRRRVSMQPAGNVLPRPPGVPLELDVFGAPPPPPTWNGRRASHRRSLFAVDPSLFTSKSKHSGTGGAALPPRRPTVTSPRQEATMNQ